MVYDFGGGTMDISIVKAYLDDKKGKTFKVNSITGDPLLGGDDIDKKIAEKFAQDLGLDFNEADESTKRVLRQKSRRSQKFIYQMQKIPAIVRGLSCLGKAMMSKSRLVLMILTWK